MDVAKTDPAAPLRVWLDIGYDGGRYGAWMLDLPGCFAWRADHAAALAAAPDAAAGFLRWLRDHGEDGGFAPPGPAQLVGEASSTVVGGYERQATFAADHREVSADELAAARRRLTWAREDLLGFLPGVLAARHDDSGTGVDGRPEVAPEVVVRHVAGGEIWLAGRLDGAARYAGPGRDAELEAYLSASREWALGQLERLWAVDPSLERVDGKGETWTLAKVIRRMVCHSLDHLAELERRLPAAG